MKLIDIFEEREFKAYTLKTTIDPETGRSSSTVQYNPVYNLHKSLEELDKNFQKAVQRKKEDEKLAELEKVYTKLRREIQRHIDKNYR